MLPVDCTWWGRPKDDVWRTMWGTSGPENVWCGTGTENPAADPGTSTGWDETKARHPEGRCNSIPSTRIKFMWWTMHVVGCRTCYNNQTLTEVGLETSGMFHCWWASIGICEWAGTGHNYVNPSSTGCLLTWSDSWGSPGWSTTVTASPSQGGRESGVASWAGWEFLSLSEPGTALDMVDSVWSDNMGTSKRYRWASGYW